MPRIAGIDLQDNWKLDYALTKLRGIGWPLSKKVIATLNMDSSTRLKDLNADEIAKITAELDNYNIEGDLARVIRGDIKRLQTIGAYRGIRHSRGLPVRGQRTRSNARTKRGKRKTVGAFAKEVLSKQAPAAAEGAK